MTLNLTEETVPEGYERLVFAEDTESGLQAFICVHSTTLGPAAGGCRMWDYATLDEARRDVLRLAQGMTCKNAMADLALGGGKSVIVGNARTDKSPALLRAFGRAVQSLNGSYYTAEDVGISPEDMKIVAEETPYAVGLEGGDYGTGDPSPFTAQGVFQCLQVGAEVVFGTRDLTGRRVLVQGLGHVGMSLAEKLHSVGADLIVADINDAALQHAKAALGATICDTAQVFETEMDIFAPCALGGVLTNATVEKLTAKLVCGAANNQLETPEVADELRAKGIRYLPDYVVNAGGIIIISHEGPHFDRDKAMQQVAGIHDTCLSIFERAKREQITTAEIADKIALERLERVRNEKGRLALAS